MTELFLNLEGRWEEKTRLAETLTGRLLLGMKTAGNIEIERERLLDALARSKRDGLEEGHLRGEKPIGEIKIRVTKAGEGYGARALANIYSLFPFGADNPQDIDSHGKEIRPMFPAFAGKGIARKSLAAMLEKIKSRHGQDTEVFFQDNHPASVTFFEKMGFKPKTRYPLTFVLQRLQQEIPAGENGERE